MNMIKCALQIYVIQIKHNMLRIPTGGRLTSWIFTRRGGVEFGATEDKSIQWQGRGFEPGTSGLQVQRPTTRPRSPPCFYAMRLTYTGKHRRLRTFFTLEVFVRNDFKLRPLRVSRDTLSSLQFQFQSQVISSILRTVVDFSTD